MIFVRAMKTTIRILVLGLLCFAASVIPASASPACDNGTAGNGALYFGGSYSCQIGDLVFSNFSYSASATGSGLLIDASDLTLAVLNAGNPYGPGVGFDLSTVSADFAATSPGSSSEGTIDFTVTELVAADAIDGYLLGQNGNAGGNPGTTAGTYEYVCSPAPCDPTSGPVSLFTGITGSGATPTASAGSPGYPSIQVQLLMEAEGNSIEVEEPPYVLFSDSPIGVPEPSTLALCAFGFLLFIGLRRRLA